ncbi:MAG: hypothetical protein B7Y80_21200 [Hyphomicrobium sp. 32-62-53]|nr:MAG: hypothetical protein B7Z29_21115 [Hyphomicrobium sp. 12-62-95]OYX97008.1 MAG: hypothetical protein B7Y80_21200 [Hyphomicrobium sp. 32-62-53]
MKPSKWSWQSVHPMRIPTLVAAGVAVVLAVPHQMLEIYRALAQGLASAADPRDAITFHIELAQIGFGVTSMCLAIWWVARRNVIVHLQQVTGSGLNEFRPAAICTWFPRLIAVIPMLALGTGLLVARVAHEHLTRINEFLVEAFTAQFLPESGELSSARELAAEAAAARVQFNDWLLYLAIGAFGCAVLIFLLISVFDALWNANRRLAHRHQEDRWAIGLLAVSITAIGAAVATDPLVLARGFGTFGLLSIFAVILLFMLYALERLGKTVEVPLITLLVALGLTWSLLDLNDNHDVRAFAGPKLPTSVANSEPEAPSLDNALRRWWDSRQDRPKYVGQRYPIYVVAAQGGGVYAATHSAKFLSRTQDICPGFAHHLFAISGVSGGSVGSAIFASMTLDYDWSKVRPEALYGCYGDGLAPRAQFTDATEDVFRGDFLSPLVAGLLFPDFLQRFLPWPVYNWDRARALEHSFEGAYRDGLEASGFPVATKDSQPSAHSESRLASRYVIHWNPEQNPHTPALFLNTTETTSGERRVIAPFAFKGIGLRFLPVWHREGVDRIGLAAPLDPPMSTAAILSARFPWLTPAASFWETDGTNPEAQPVKIRIVDGGYFENSGVATAVDLVNDMLKSAQRLGISDHIQIKFIVFTSADFERPRVYGLGEFLEPIRTMLNTREARARIEIGSLFEMASNVDNPKAEIQTSVTKLELRGYGYPLPLGWRLSGITRGLIDFQNNEGSDCDLTKLPESEEGAGVPAGCAREMIRRSLSP